MLLGSLRKLGFGNSKLQVFILNEELGHKLLLKQEDLKTMQKDLGG